MGRNYYFFSCRIRVFAIGNRNSFKISQITFSAFAVRSGCYIKFFSLFCKITLISFQVFPYYTIAIRRLRNHICHQKSHAVIFRRRSSGCRRTNMPSVKTVFRVLIVTFYHGVPIIRQFIIRTKVITSFRFAEISRA